MGRGRVVPATFWPDFPALSRARGVMLGAKCSGWDARGAAFTLRPPPQPPACGMGGDGRLVGTQIFWRGDGHPLGMMSQTSTSRLGALPSCPPFWPPALPLGAAGLWEALLLRELGAVSLLRCPRVISLQLRSDTIAMVMTQRHSEALLSLAKSLSPRSISQISPHPLKHSVAISELLTSPFQPGVSLSSAAPGRGSSASIPVLSLSPASSCAMLRIPATSRLYRTIATAASPASHGCPAASALVLVPPSCFLPFFAHFTSQLYTFGARAGCLYSLSHQLPWTSWTSWAI